MLLVENLNLALGGRTILSEISFELRTGEKVGLVGVNGAGKTSLLKILAGQSLPDGGTVLAPDNLAYLPQEPRVAFSPEQTALECLLDSRGLLRLARDMAEAERDMAKATPQSSELASALAHYGKLQLEWERRGGYEGETLARQMLDGLGLGHVSLDRPFANLSGGQKTRLALAAQLFRWPDLLLLDEPTNHLDRTAAAWLMDFLGKFPGTVLLVSHDLVLLDRAISRVLRIDEQTGQLEIYPGNYSRYVAQREARRIQAEKQARTVSKEINRLQTTADRFHAGTRAVQARQIERRIEKLRETVPTAPKESKGPRLKAIDPPPSARVVLEVNDLWKAYDQNIVLAGVEFALERGQKLALIGPNGAGKTTLLKTITGGVPIDDGRVEVGQSVRIGYYAQEHESLDPAATVFDEARRSATSTALPHMPDAQIRAFLGTFLFTGMKVYQQVGTLSGGERTRLALAKLFLEKSNVLLLDEPTNNLDPASQEALLKVLQDYRGSLIIVCHMADFMERLAPERALILPSGEHAFFDPSLLALEAPGRRGRRAEAARGVVR